MEPETKVETNTPKLKTTTETAQPEITETETTEPETVEQEPTEKAEEPAAGK